MGKDGIRADPSKVKALEDWRTPSNVSELKSFFGLATYFRKFIPNFSIEATALTTLTSHKVQWNWTIDCQTAFQRIKHLLSAAPVLTIPDPTGPYEVEIISDASDTGIGAILFQHCKPIAHIGAKFQIHSTRN